MKQHLCKPSILQNENLFVEDNTFSKFGRQQGDTFRLKGTNFYYRFSYGKWFKRVEYIEVAILFEEMFDELMIDEKISNQFKELVLFNLVELRKID